MARGTKCWFNGKILPVEEAKISLFTHGLHYGTGAFEGIRCYKQKNGGGAVFRLREHMQRLSDSCKLMDVKIPYSVDEMIKAVLETCRANGFEECYIRPIAYIADGPLGVYPGTNPPVDLAIITWEWGSYLGDKGINEGTRLKTATYIRPHVNSSMSKGKITGQYCVGVVAKREAIMAGYDEALMLDTEGFLTEGTGENLFMIKNNVVKTTPQTAILNGITRQTAMEYFRHKGYQVQEMRFTRDELVLADEAFLTGTAAEITPIKEIDGRLIGDGKPGPLSSKLKADYAAMVRGELPEYGKGWLTTI